MLQGQQPKQGHPDFPVHFIILKYEMVFHLEMTSSAQAGHGSHLLMHLQRMRSTKELDHVVRLTEAVPFFCHQTALSHLVLTSR